MRIGQQKQHVHFKTCLFRQAASLNVRTSKDQCFGNFNIVVTGRPLKRGFSSFVSGSFGSGIWIRTIRDEHFHHLRTIREKSGPIGDNVQERFRSAGIPYSRRWKPRIGSKHSLKRIRVAPLDRTNYFVCQLIVCSQDHSRFQKTIVGR